MLLPWRAGLLRQRALTQHPDRCCLWASQTGNAEDFAAKLGEQLGGAQLRSMNDTALSDLADAGDVVIVTSTFGDGGPPDNGADFWERLGVAGGAEPVRCAVRRAGDRGPVL